MSSTFDTFATKRREYHSPHSAALTDPRRHDTQPSDSPEPLPSEPGGALGPRLDGENRPAEEGKGPEEGHADAAVGHVGT